MNWGKKNHHPYPSSASFSSSPTSSSRSRPSFISRVFPTSWFSKIKLSGENGEPKPEQLKQKEVKNSDSLVDEGRFYSGEGDAFWRLSFGEDNRDGKQSRSVLLYQSDDEPELPNSSCRNLRLKITKVGEDETMNLSSMRKAREVKILPDARKFGREGEVKEKTPLKEHEGTRSLRKLKKNPEKESTESRDYSDSEWKEKDEIKWRTEKQRKSLHISRELQGRRAKGSSKIKIYSRRTPSKQEICRIKAIEDMGKSKWKTKNKRREKKGEEGRRKLESFAVAKCSLDPHGDFRDSMMEMIMEKKMKKAEEVEELLACYLTLNSDEYHQLIIKVFRQVWFDLNINANRVATKAVE